MKRSIKQTIEHWNHLFPYAHIPKNEDEYEKLLRFVDELMQLSRQKKDERITSLLELVAKNIEEYESRYATKAATPIEMLEFLMEQDFMSHPLFLLSKGRIFKTIILVFSLVSLLNLRSQNP